MWNNSNPAELYTGTTWELITAGKYIQTGNTALTTGGSNTVNIGKANLPAVKLKVDSFSLTTQPHTHKYTDYSIYDNGGLTGYKSGLNSKLIDRVTQSGGGENTGTASPNTETLGNGTALNIQPSYITLKFWKRLS